MNSNKSNALARRALLRVFAATAVASAPTFSKASAYLCGAGDTRRLRLYAVSTGEEISTVYWADGEYVPEALAEINYLFRDWRNNQVHQIDVRTLDILASVHRLLDADEPYNLLSGYRSPQSAMLRSRLSEVASTRRHTIGQAADVRMRSRSVEQVARAAAACQMGGVGRYSCSDFTHIDCGPVQVWGA